MDIGVEECLGTLVVRPLSLDEYLQVPEDSSSEVPPRCRLKIQDTGQSVPNTTCSIPTVSISIVGLLAGGDGIGARLEPAVSDESSYSLTSAVHPRV